MKNNLFLWVLVLAPWCGWGQTVDGKRIDQDSTIRYVKVWIWDVGKKEVPMFRSTVEYGQPRTPGHTFTILDASGSPRLWVSDMEVVNYFAGFGWRFMYGQRMPMGTASGAADYLVFERRQ